MDSDLNDPASTPVSNDTLVNAQAISSDTEIRGFVTELPTETLTDNFQLIDDFEDIYQASLVAGQVISLDIADFQAGNATNLDLDLYLLDTGGNVVASSIAFSSRIEQVTVTADADYFIVVQAFRGQSNYSLVVSDGAQTTPQTPQQVFMSALAPQQAVMLSEAATAASGLIKEVHTDRDSGLAFDSMPTIRTVHIPASDLEAPRYGVLSPDFPRERLGIENGEPANETYTAKLALIHHIKETNHRAGAEVLQPMHYAELHAGPPPDPDLQWNLPLIEWEEALTDVEAILPNPDRPLIAVLDSGVLSAHPKIAPVLVDQRDFVPSFIDGDGFDAEAEEDVVVDDPNPDDCFDFHGTHVATTATAPLEGGEINGRTMVGALPFADLMMLKLGYNRDPNCRFIVGDVAGAIRYAAGLPNSSGELPPRRADVINMSFGGPGQNAATRAAIEEAVAAGVIVVASAGNEGDESASPPPNFPGSYADVFAVAATDINNERAPYSSFYPQVEVAAPGGDGRFDLNGDGLADAVVGGVGRLNNAGTDFEPRYALYQGTSMASPHVAAGFALMKSIFPDLTSDQARQLLEEGLLTTDIAAPGRDSDTGFGLISFRKMADVAFQLRDDGLNLPPDFRIDPGALDLGNIRESAELTITRTGEPDFTIDTLTFSGMDLDDTQLLPVAPIDVDAEGYGVYEVSIDRRNIPAGDYVASVDVTASTAEVKRVPVTFTIPDASLEAETAPALLILERLVDGEFTSVTSFDTTGAGAEFDVVFELAEGETGTFRLVYTTDMDNDGEVCDPGELGGSFPGRDCDSTETFDLPTEEELLVEAILERLPD
ncbi:MAG: S8 family serine peptidase [Pseudomonadota bacterium]